MKTLAVVSAGGIVGAVARYGLAVAWPGIWMIWIINITGCFLMGILMELLARHRPDSRLLRPFLGTGVLGGYTTFSTATVDVLRSPPATALAYLGATLIGALFAVWAGSVLGRSVLFRARS
ncbi:fluoride efflux transporter FluC [Actinoplanes sp. NPDC051494]|uniref:fluoride efflux transporter FluC n=1 Tax=Actinoplanes sp. NPDC051494 TaxID=3363907 RepID=UPI0037AF882F